MQYASNGQVQGSSLLDKPRVPVGDVWALFERDCKDIIVKTTSGMANAHGSITTSETASITV